MIHYICPECEDEGDLPDGSPIKYCGICAGDVGRDIVLRLIAANKPVEFDRKKASKGVIWLKKFLQYPRISSLKLSPLSGLVLKILPVIKYPMRQKLNSQNGVTKNRPIQEDEI